MADPGVNAFQETAALYAKLMEDSDRAHDILNEMNATELRQYVETLESLIADVQYVRREKGYLK